MKLLSSRVYNIKLNYCDKVDGLPSIKISDNPAKAIGDKETIKFTKWQVKQQIKSYKKSLKE